MKRLARMLLLLLLPLCGAAGCGSTLPTVLLDIMGIPDMTGRITAVVMNSGRTSTTALYRDSTNSYSTAFSGMPPMLPSPGNIQMAFDLPEKTTGLVKITLSFDTAPPPMMGMPMGMLTTTHVGCASADVSPGGLLRVSVTARPVPVQCP